MNRADADAVSTEQKRRSSRTAYILLAVVSAFGALVTGLWGLLQASQGEWIGAVLVVLAALFAALFVASIVLAVRAARPLPPRR